MTGLGGWMTKGLYDTARQAAVCTEQGLLLLNDGKKRIRLIPWEALPFAGEVRNSKGTAVLVLSGESLSQKQMKGFVRRSEIRMAMDVDGTVILHSNLSHGYDAFREEVQSHLGTKFHAEDS